MNALRRPAGAAVTPRHPTLVQRCVARCVWLTALAVAASQRRRIVDPTGALAVIRRSPVIFAIWHNRLAFSLLSYRILIGSQTKARQLAALVSASRDGALLAAVLEAFKVQPVRGSSSRRGSQALRELITWAERGLDLAITPDGPRGPRYVAHPGVIALARATDLPIIPASFNFSRKWELSSWDRFQIPVPFGAYQLELGPALTVSQDSDRDVDLDLAELQRRLMAITRD
ncbi:MAG: lysophospholipid acyltransferase family protein [Verrucomicrobiales bacterium]|nr:lysophospholipid acyltransferase family protein [Verrucomicrobiales bacterium]